MKNRPMIAEELEQIRNANGGSLNPSAVVSFGRDNPESAIHRELNWDDTDAAEKYRVYQAGRLIRAVVTVVNTPPTKVNAAIDNRNHSSRAYYSLPSNRGKAGYQHVDDIMRDEQKRYELLEMAAAELESFRRRYSHLEELAKVFEAGDKFKDSLRKPKGKLRSRGKSA